MDVLMPQMGETVAEGTLTVWHKSVGEKVTEGELLFEIGTDKVEMEVPAPVTGVLKEIKVTADSTVAVGEVLAVIDDGKGDAAPASKPQPAPEPEPEPAPAPEPVPEPAARPAATTPARRRDTNRKLSPAVRKLIAENDLDPGQIMGTGKDGRLKRSDVLAYLASGKAQPAPRTATGAALVPAPAARPQSGDGRTVIPFNRIRRMTAEHMVRSKATSPHVSQGIDVDFSRVDRVRKEKGQAWKAREGFSLTYLPFIARAVCDAIAEFPNINAHVEGDNLVVYDRVHLAIAIDLNFEGLVAPVIKNADGMTPGEIARAVNDLAARAKAGQLMAEDYEGATYTISNNGSFGTLFTTPIINQPQVAILSTDAIAKRPMVVDVDGEDMIAIRPQGILTQAFDHRALDGAYSAAFLRRLKEIIETKPWAASVV